MQSQSKGKRLICLRSMMGTNWAPGTIVSFGIRPGTRDGAASLALQQAWLLGALGSFNVGKLGPWKGEATVSAQRHSEKCLVRLNEMRAAHPDLGTS